MYTKIETNKSNCINLCNFGSVRLIIINGSPYSNSFQFSLLFLLLLLPSVLFAKFPYRSVNHQNEKKNEGKTHGGNVPLENACSFDFFGAFPNFI